MEIEGGKGGIKQVGFHPPTLQLCSRMRLLLAGDFLKPSLPASFGPYEGINQGFARPGPDTLTTSPDQLQTKDKKYSWGNKLRPEMLLASLGKSLHSTTVQKRKDFDKQQVNRIKCGI